MPRIDKTVDRIPKRSEPKQQRSRALVEAILVAAALSRPFLTWSPALTRSSVRLICHDHTFDGSRAREELGYKPLYEHEESLARTIDWLRAEIESGASDAA